MVEAYVLTAGAGIAGLRLQRSEPRPLGAGEVRVALKAAALNARDLMVAGGVYPDPPSRPVVPLADGAGVVVETAAGARRFKVGDRVITTYWPAWRDGPIAREKIGVSLGAQLDGTLAQELVAHEEWLVAAPASLDDAGAAAIPCAGVTAWNALFVAGGLRPGASVLILGTGSVAVWALQLAAAAGLHPIVTSSSDDKLGRAEALGARGAINYVQTPEWSDEVRRLTGGQGVDLVLEVGGQGTLARSVAAARFGGDVVVIGGLSGFGEAAISAGSLIGGAKRLTGISVGSRRMTEDLVRFIDQRGIVPVVDRVFPFAEAAAAYARLESGGAFGKVAVRID